MPVEIKSLNNPKVSKHVCRKNRSNRSNEASCAYIVQDIFNKQKEANVDTSYLSGQGRIGKNIINNYNSANTRPFILYLPNGEEFYIRINSLFSYPGGDDLQKPPSYDRTSILRVEEVRDYYALVRGLTCSTPSKPTHRQKSPNPEPTTQYFQCSPYCCWVDLNEFIAVQCFSDIFVSIPCPVDDIYPTGPPAKTKK